MTGDQLVRIKPGWRLDGEHRPSMGPSDGEPGGWKVVCATRDSVTAVSQCICGNDDCTFSATAYAPLFVQQVTHRHADGSFDSYDDFGFQPT